MQKSEAGKHLMPRLNAVEFANDALYRERMLSYVRDLGVMGFCLFTGGADDVISAVSSLKAVATGDLIFSADCEFGLPMRFTCGTEFPDAMAVAKTGDPLLAYKVGEAIAKEMRALGLGWNFAPVADVNSNPDNPIINTRSFGDDPVTVAKYGTHYMQGLQSQGVLATAKHFPGHGDTSVDSHRAIPYLDGDLQRFETLELAPFKAMVDAGVESVMTGHLAAPTLAAELGGSEAFDLPATLSHTLSTTLLRERLGFRGIVVTDAMEMKAIRNIYGVAEASQMSYEAGADIVLMPPDVDAAFQALLTSEERPYPLPHIMMSEPVGSITMLERQHASLAHEVAQKSIQITGNLDVKGRDLIVLTDHRPEVERKAADFIRRVSSHFRSVKQINTGSNIDINNDAVLAVFHRARGYIDADATEWTIPRMMQALASRFEERGNTLSGLILFGNPYLDHHFAVKPGFVLKTFSESSPSIVAASQKLIETHLLQ